MKKTGINQVNRESLSYIIFKITFATSYANHKDKSNTNALLCKKIIVKKIIALAVKFEAWVRNLDVLWIANHNVTLAATLNCYVPHSVIFKKGDNRISLSLIFICLIYSDCKQDRIWPFFWQEQCLAQRSSGLGINFLLLSLADATTLRTDKYVQATEVI